MEIKITGYATKNFYHREVGDPVEVEIDLYDIDTGIIAELAETRLSMIYPEECYCDELEPDDFSSEDLIEVLENRGYEISDKPKSFNYPDNSIRIVDAWQKLIDNMDRIPVEKIEELIKDL